MNRYQLLCSQERNGIGDPAEESEKKMALRRIRDSTSLRIGCSRKAMTLSHMQHWRNCLHFTSIYLTGGG